MDLHLSHLGKKGIESWQLLVHVCWRWRNLVFESPRRLNLRLFCPLQTPVRDWLKIWPAFPLIVQDTVGVLSAIDNVILALGQSNRVCQVWLSPLSDWQLENVLAPMQVSEFYISTHMVKHYQSFLILSWMDLPHVCDSSSCLALHFRDCRNYFCLLLNSPLFTLLVFLILGTFHPKRLSLPSPCCPVSKCLSLEFQSPQSLPDWDSRSLPPPKRSVLPALNEFHFKGVTKYLEELVACIDTPQLDRMYISFFNQIDFDHPRLAQFINYTPRLRAGDEAHVIFDDSAAGVALQCPTSKNRIGNLVIKISCKEPDWQLSSVEHVCNLSLLTFPRLRTSISSISIRN